MNTPYQRLTYYDDIDCHFIICQTCFWTATMFNSHKKGNSQNTTMSACPICSSKNISICSIRINDDDICRSKSQLLDAEE